MESSFDCRLFAVVLEDFVFAVAPDLVLDFVVDSVVEDFDLVVDFVVGVVVVLVLVVDSEDSEASDSGSGAPDPDFVVVPDPVVDSDCGDDDDDGGFGVFGTGLVVDSGFVFGIGPDSEDSDKSGRRSETGFAVALDFVLDLAVVRTADSSDCSCVVRMDVVDTKY